MKIIATPNSKLRRVALPIKNLDKKLQEQIADLIKTLKSAKDPEGVGLAAPQVGINRRIFIVTFNGVPEIFINPVISNPSAAMLSDIHRRSKERWLEGCLSVPKLWGFVDRPYSVEIDYLTPVAGKLEKRHRKLEDVDASYVQHENDHLNGILFTDRILEQKGTIFQETDSGLVPLDK